MAAERPAGSNRGRSSIDWEEAFAYYASLPDPERSYRAVADQFQVSVRTVEKHGRQAHWKTRLAEVKRQAAVALNEELVGKQIESLHGALKLAEATCTRYAQQLQAGSVRVTPSDLSRMVALQNQIADTLAALNTTTNGVDSNDTEPGIDEAEHQLDVLRALDDSGALARILNLVHPQPDES